MLYLPHYALPVRAPEALARTPPLRAVPAGEVPPVPHGNSRRAGPYPLEGLKTRHGHLAYGAAGNQRDSLCSPVLARRMPPTPRRVLRQVVYGHMMAAACQRQRGRDLALSGRQSADTGGDERAAAAGDDRASQPVQE